MNADDIEHICNCAHLQLRRFFFTLHIADTIFTIPYNTIPAFQLSILHIGESRRHDAAESYSKVTCP